MGNQVSAPEKVYRAAKANDYQALQVCLGPKSYSRLGLLAAIVQLPCRSNPAHLRNSKLYGSCGFNCTLGSNSKSSFEHSWLTLIAHPQALLQQFYRQGGNVVQTKFLEFQVLL